MIRIEYASFFNRNIFSFVRKDVKQKYDNQINKQSGIYLIHNKITGDKYIGQSKNITRRLRDHKTKLKQNNHIYKNGGQSILQKAWNKYGEDAFEFKAIEFCNPCKLNEREQYWINKLNCNRSISGIGYNLNSGGAGGHSGSKKIKGTIVVNNGKIQIHIYPDELEEYEKKGYIKGLLPDYKNKINASRIVLTGSEHPHYGKKWSKDHREKIQKFYSERKGYVSPRKGVPLSKDTIKKIKEAWENKKPNENSLRALKNYVQSQHIRSVIQSTLEGIDIDKFNSIKEANLKTGVSKGNIVSCCKGNRKSAGGFRWRYIDE